MTLPRSDPTRTVIRVRLRPKNAPTGCHHFHVAEAHPFATANAEISLGHNPEQAAAGQRAQSRVGNGKHCLRRRKIEPASRQPAVLCRRAIG